MMKMNSLASNAPVLLNMQGVLIYFASRTMDKKDRDFLVRSQAVTGNYEARLSELTEKITTMEESALRGSFAAVMAFITLDNRLTRLLNESHAHKKRVKRLTEQLRSERALNSLCTDANRLAGTDGANFFTKVGNVIKEQADVEI